VVTDEAPALLLVEEHHPVELHLGQLFPERADPFRPLTLRVKVDRGGLQASESHGLETEGKGGRICL
jgi:hypothetical protein